MRRCPGGHKRLAGVGENLSGKLGYVRDTCLCCADHEHLSRTYPHTAGARFQSLTEPWADTTSHVGKFILTVFAGLAEFERDLIRERARVGRVAAYNRTRVTTAALPV